MGTTYELQPYNSSDADHGHSPFCVIFWAESKAQDTLTAAKQAPLSAALLSRVNTVIDADSARLIAVFKDLHEHPEIGFTEKRTAAIVPRSSRHQDSQSPKAWARLGWSVCSRMVPAHVMVCADMDSNSVHETTGLPYAATRKQRLEDGSEIDVMHACGHDAHVTWLLGLAKAMAALKEDWSGTLVVYAQPLKKSGSGPRPWSRTSYGNEAFRSPTMRSAHTRHPVRSATFRVLQA